MLLKIKYVDIYFQVLNFARNRIFLKNPISEIPENLCPGTYVNLVQPLTQKAVLLRNLRYGKRVASESGKIGVIERITNDDVIRFFSDFHCIGRDGYCFGDLGGDGNHSEVICLLRNQETDQKPN